MKKYQVRPGIFCKDSSGKVYLFLSDKQAVDIGSGEYLFTSEYDKDMQPTVGWAPEITAWGERAGMKDTGESCQFNINWFQTHGKRARAWNNRRSG